MKANPATLFLTSILSVFFLSPLPLYAQATVQATGDVTPFPDPNPTEAWDLGDSSLTVGNSDAGTLLIEDAGTATSLGGFIGSQNGSTGDVTVAGTGSTWNITGDAGHAIGLTVGEYGSGTLTINHEGSVVIYGNAKIGAEVGSQGSVTVTDRGSSLNTTGYLDIGRNGAGTLMINGGGSVSATEAVYIVSDSSVTVTGDGSTLTSKGVDIGSFGFGSFTISDGGKAFTNGRVVSIGGNSPGTDRIGEVIVTGAGSVWNTDYIIVGNFGTGMLTINDGGSVSTTYSLGIGSMSGSNGLVTVSGVGSTLTTNGLTVGESGTGALTINDSGSVSIGSWYQVYIGSSIGSSGMVTVSGTGSLWANGHSLIIGDQGSGTLLVESGGAVTSFYGAIGNQGGSTGVATVTGAGSQWTTTNAISVGAGGTGTLNITDGGLVTAAHEVSIAGTGLVGESGVGRTGSVTVNGTGSSLAMDFGLAVGSSGTGTLRIENGGSVSVGWSSYVGNNSGSEGTAIVTGNGSQWINTGGLYVGMQGKGTMRVEDGGAVSNTTGAIGYVSASEGSVTVTGAGSQWLNSQSLYVGGSNTSAGGAGTLLVETGGTVSVGGDLKIWAPGSVTLDGGTIQLTSNLSNAGTLDLGSNALEVGGDYTQAGTGTLSLLISSTATYGSLVVDGALTLDGALEISLTDGYVVALGDSFQLLSFASTMGNFSSFDLPDLNAGLTWDYSQLTTNGMLSVTAVPEPSAYAAMLASVTLLFAFWRRRAAGQRHV